MKLLFLLVTFVLGVITVQSIPYGSYQRRNSQKVNGYLKRLSSNYLNLLKNFLNRKQQYQASSKRSLNEDYLLDTESQRELNEGIQLDYHDADLLKRNSHQKQKVMDGYLKRISSNYLKMIKDFLARGKGKFAKRENENDYAKSLPSYLSGQFQKDDVILPNADGSIEERELLTKLATDTIDREIKRELIQYAMAMSNAEEQQQPMLNRKDEIPMLNRRESPMLNKKNIPMLHKKESPKLNKGDDTPMLNKRESPMLNRKEISEK